MLKAKLELSPSVSIEVEAPEGGSAMEGQKAIIESVGFWQQLPSACPMPGCGAPLVFFARHPQNFHYYGLKCTADKPHECNFGERKDGSTLYMKDDWKDAYQGEGSTEPASAQSSPSGQQKTAGGPKAAPALIASLMRKGNEKGMKTKDAVIAFIQGCKDTCAWAGDIKQPSDLTEAQAKEMIEMLDYV